MKRLLPTATLLLLQAAPSASRAELAHSSPDRPLASLISPRCLVYVEATGLAPLFEQGLDHPLLQALLASELGRALLSDLPLAPAAGIAWVDAWLGAPALPWIAQLSRRGLGLGFDPRTGKTVVVARGSDAEAVGKGLTLVFDGVERQFGWPGALDQAQKNWDGAEVWVLGNDGFVARRDALLVFGNDEVLVRDTLALAADPAGCGLLDRPGFAAHYAERASAALWTWLELRELEAFADAGYRELRAANRTPAVQALLGAEIAALLSARSLSVALTLDGERELALRLHAFEAPCAEPLAPLARAGDVPAALAEGENVAQALLYRDYARFVHERSELFPPEVLPKFAEAITNGALFFGGQDLGEEVLTGLAPWFRLVARNLEFAEGLRPEIQLPGLAFVAVLEKEERGAEWITAFQTIVSIVNVDRAQKGQRGMQLHLEREGDVEISSARFSAPAPGEGVDVRYNLEPALAVVGRHLVLGTHEQLVREVVRELAHATPVAAANATETLDLDARGLGAVVTANSELLVAKKQLEEGLEREAAESEIRTLRLALALFEGAHIELRGDAPTAPELVLRLPLARGGAVR